MGTKIKKKSFKFKNQSKLLITLDWLTLNVEDKFQLMEFDGQGIKETENFIYKLQEFGRTSHFNKMLKVYEKGQVIGTITFDSNNPKMLKGRAHIKFENHLFYSGQIKEVVERIIVENSLQSIKISRVDVAVDGVYFHPFLNKFLYENKLKNSIRRVRDTDNITPVGFTRDSIQNHKFTNFYIGQRGNRNKGTSKSSKFARYYNKTAEIKETGNKKEYILEHYKINGFDLTKDVYRYEVELSSTYISSLKGFEFMDIFDKDYLISLLNETNKNFFEFVHNDNKNITRCTRLVMFRGFKTETIYQRIKRVIKDKVRTIKVSIKRAISDVMTGIYSGNENIVKAQSMINYVRQSVNSYGLNDWFNTMFDWVLIEQKIKSRLQNVEISKSQTNVRFWNTESEEMTSQKSLFSFWANNPTEKKEEFQSPYLQMVNNLGIC